MTDLQTIPIVIVYDEQDCKEMSFEELILDIGITVKEKLKEEITIHPLKCNVTIIYNSIIQDTNGNCESTDI